MVSHGSTLFCTGYCCGLTYPLYVGGHSNKKQFSPLLVVAGFNADSTLFTALLKASIVSALSGTILCTLVPNSSDSIPPYDVGRIFAITGC